MSQTLLPPRSDPNVLMIIDSECDFLARVASLTRIVAYDLWLPVSRMARTSTAGADFGCVASQTVALAVCSRMVAREFTHMLLDDVVGGLGVPVRAEG